MASISTLPATIVLLFFLAATATATPPKVFNVKSYGAVADGKTDNSRAFLSAWTEACAREGRAKVVIPEGSFLTGPVTFKGPCKGPIVFQVQGSIVAPADLAAFPNDDWVAFQYVTGLRVTGHGKFDGQGALAWPHNECPKKQKCKILPTSIKFSFVNNSTIQGISSVDSKMFHMMVFACNNLMFRKIKISAPENSPNTDGIHIGVSTNITVSESFIGTGDDCVSIGPGTVGVTISKVFCGPGHGISVGSLGKSKDDKDVTDLTVSNCTLTGTMNGVRIKTWEDSYVLTASNFTFEDIVMNNVSNPIIIDQEYCPTGNCNAKSPSLVKIRDVKFRNIRGTSSSNVAVNLKCSKTVPCKGVELSNINLIYSGQDEVKATTACLNVVGASLGTMIPPPCI